MKKIIAGVIGLSLFVIAGCSFWNKENIVVDESLMEIVETVNVELISTGDVSQKLMEYKDKDLGISFSYPSKWGDVTKEVEDRSILVSEGNTERDGKKSVFLSVKGVDAKILMSLKNNDFGVPRGAFWGDSATKIIGQEYINSLCSKSSLSGEDTCETKTNINGVKYVRQYQDKYIPTNLVIGYDGNIEKLKEEKGRGVVFYSIFNPNNDFRGIVISNERFPDENIEDFDIIIENLNFLDKEIEITEDNETTLGEIQARLKDEDVILNYYKKLSNKDFDAASDMIYGQTKTEEEIAATYRNISVAIPYHIRPLGDNTYKFYVYYVDEGETYSTTYEVVKKVVDGKLESISSKRKQSITPTEFSLVDPEGKYEIFNEGEINIYDYFNINNGGTKNLAQESLGLFLQDPNITEEQKKLITEKEQYFEDLFAKYSPTDTMKEYRAKDKTFVTDGEGDPRCSKNCPEHTDTYYWRGDVTDDGVRIFVLENRGSYTVGDQQFLEDFRTTSGIPSYRPIKAGDEYLVIENYIYCGASICPFKIDEIHDLIKGDTRFNIN